ncbi:hypothetical protein [Halobaculum litoreum]|uniref:hypothetical protein n=1 Tax=Halobaculum litoreum TaxID=3031998 RepID=UPI0024C2748B|nr:hypothetical protein [Halobaculum sp. DT92]
MDFILSNNGIWWSWEVFGSRRILLSELGSNSIIDFGFGLSGQVIIISMVGYAVGTLYARHDLRSHRSEPWETLLQNAMVGSGVEVVMTDGTTVTGRLVRIGINSSENDLLIRPEETDSPDETQGGVIYINSDNLSQLRLFEPVGPTVVDLTE